MLPGIERLPLRLRQVIAFFVWAVAFTALLTWLFDGEFTPANIIIVAFAGLAALAIIALGERAWRRVRRAD